MLVLPMIVSSAIPFMDEIEIEIKIDAADVAGPEDFYRDFHQDFHRDFHRFQILASARSK